jgi:hypothetical protein
MTRKAKLIGSENITIEEIQRITGYDIEGADKEYGYIIKKLGTQSEFLQVSQYCKFNDLDENEVIEFLNQFRYEDKWTAEDHDPYISDEALETEIFLNTINQKRTV